MRIYGNFSVARDRLKQTEKKGKKRGEEGAPAGGAPEAPVHLVRKAGVPVGGSQKVKGYYEPI